MDEFLNNFATWWPVLQSGLAVTLMVTLVSMPVAMLIGLLIAVIRSSKSRVAKLLRPIVIVYVEVMRGLPLILILFLLYFALPAFGLRISSSATIVGIVGLSMNLSAYLSEVFRAALLSVDPGQSEAALSLGMSPRRTFVKVIFPQAIRVAVPTLGGYFIALLKDSSLLGFISVEELTRTGVNLVSVTFRAGEVYLIVGAMYLVCSIGSSLLIKALERRLDPALKRKERRREGEISAALTSQEISR